MAAVKRAAGTPYGNYVARLEAVHRYLPVGRRADDQPDMAEEVEALRAEVATLRAELAAAQAESQRDEATMLRAQLAEISGPYSLPDTRTTFVSWLL